MALQQLHKTRHSHRGIATAAQNMSFTSWHHNSCTKHAIRILAPQQLHKSVALALEANADSVCASVVDHM